MRQTLTIALPLAAAQITQMLMQLTDTIMIGHLGSAALAAGGLGASIYFTFKIVVQGCLTAVAALAGTELGAGRRQSVGPIVGAGMVLAVLLSVPVMAVIWFADHVLLSIGYDPSLAEDTRRFLHAAVWGVPGYLLFSVLRNFLSVLARTRIVFGVLLVCLVLNVIFNYAFIFGRLGSPEFGIAGSGAANAIAVWLMFLGLLAFILLRPEIRAYRPFAGILRVDPGVVVSILRLGWPIAGIYALEAAIFMVAATLMGLMGSNALAAHQIVSNVAAMTFMVPLALAQASTVRVAMASGAGQPASVRQAGVVAIVMGTGFMVLMAIVIAVMPRTIAGLYIDAGLPENAPVIAIARDLLLVVAAFQISDGIQCVTAGALRGLKDTQVPLIAAAIGYWGIGFAGGWVLAFPLGLGPLGIWSGLAIGLTVVAALLFRRFNRLTAPAPRLALA